MQLQVDSRGWQDATTSHSRVLARRRNVASLAEDAADTFDQARSTTLALAARRPVRRSLMHALIAELSPLLVKEDIEAVTALLERWQPRDELWRQCVEGRLHAPSSTHAQKQRLRDLLQEHSTGAVAYPIENGDACAESVGLTVSRIELDAVPTATIVELPELELEVRQVSQRLAELPAEAAGAVRRILDAAHRENLQHQARRREQFEEELTRGTLPRGSGFSRFLSSLSHYFVRLGPPASEAEIEALQTLSPMRFGNSLSELYRSVGGLS